MSVMPGTFTRKFLGLVADILSEGDVFGEKDTDNNVCSTDH